MEKVRIGIIGIGNIGQVHINQLKSGNAPHVELTAVCDVNPEALKWCDENYPSAKQFTDAEEMMKSGLIDAVLIATPHYSHSPLAIKAFENGLHVFSEKPSGVYAKQVIEMNEAAKKYNKVLTIGFMVRLTPAFATIRNLIKSGELGRIKKVIWIVTNWYRRQAYHDSSEWRSTWKGEGGGTIVNQNPHQLDLYNWMFGLPDEVFANVEFGKYYNIEVDDEASAIFKHNNGMIGLYTTATGEAPGTNRLEISADMGKLVFENDTLTFWKNEISEREFNRTSEDVFTPLKNEKSEIPLPKANVWSYAEIVENFALCVLGKAEPIASAEDGLNEVILANSIYTSAWEGGKWIKTRELDHDKYLAALNDKIEKSTYVKVVRKPKSVDMAASGNQ